MKNTLKLLLLNNYFILVVKQNNKMFVTINRKQRDVEIK